ncbi:MAG: serine/threonine-protein kinase [Planctomycetota bacterium]
MARRREPVAEGGQGSADRHPEARHGDASPQGVRDLFLEALNVPQNERESFLQTRCGEDAKLRRDVESLLASHSHLGSFLAAPLLSLPELIAGSEAEQEPGPDGMPPHACLKDGDRLGDFVIEGSLSRGGQATVYLARQCSLGGRPVALKVHGVVSDKDRKRFEHEARVAAAIHHPNLVAILGYGEDEARGLLYYAMRLVSGPTWAQAIEWLSQSPARSSAVTRKLVERTRELACALAALHERGLIHCDVKPANIILEGPHDLRAIESPAILIDYGLVRRCTSSQVTRFGTPAYAAPELLLGKQVDERSDVFSLGLCLLDILSDQGAERRPLAPLGYHTPPSRSVPGVDRDLGAVLAHALDLDPRQRYRTAAALADDLMCWLEGKPVLVRRGGPLRWCKRWVMRHPQPILTWAWRAALACVVLAVGLGLFRVGQLLCEVSRVDSLWQEARLEPLAPSLRALPPILDPPLSEDVSALAAELRALAGDDPGDDPVVQVVRVLETQGRSQAQLLSARFLERDGIQSHPVLARFLLRSSCDGVDGSPGDHLQEIILYARLFSERPDENPEDTAASEPFRQLLVDKLRAQPAGEEAFCCLTALAGCGTPNLIPAILEWLEGEIPRTTLDLVHEATRLVLQVGMRIVGRSQVCGTHSELASFDDDVYARAYGLASRFAPPGTQRPTHFDTLLDSWLRVDIFARRAAGLPLPPLLWAEPEDGWRGIRSARHDPSLREELRKGPGDFSAVRSSLFGQVFDWGVSTGAYGDPELEQEVRARIRSQACEGGFDVELATRAFDQGIASAREWMRSLPKIMAPDRDSHLGEALTRRDDPYRTLPHRVIGVGSVDLTALGIEELTGNRVLGYWSYSQGEALMAPDACGMEVRAADLKPDECLPDASFLRLGLAGVSALRLSFPQGPDATPLLLLLEAQKADRGHLPFKGVADLQLLEDGEEVGFVRLNRGSAERVTMNIPWRPSIEPRQRQIAMQLATSSTTTLWILNVAVIVSANVTASRPPAARER